MPLELVADTHDHSQCTHTTAVDELLIGTPSVISLVKVMTLLCPHMISGANWRAHDAELEKLFLKCKKKGSVADMRRLMSAAIIVHDREMRARARASIDIHNAFRDSYQGEGHQALLAMIDSYCELGPAKAIPPYNYSIDMLRSSGMGKSRTVDIAARKRFAFLLNLRDPGSVGTFSYPPTDIAVREFFSHLHSTALSDSQVQLRLGAFFIALFRKATTELKRFRPTTADDTAQWWHTRMEEGSSAERVGTRRAALYEEAIDDAETIVKSGGFHIKSAQELLETSCQGLLDALEDARSEGSPVTPVKFYISIDEAHVMTGKLRYFPHARTVYQNLGTSQLQELAVPAYLQSSFRVEHGTMLSPPFTELSFDTFATGLYTSLKEQSLNEPVSLNSHEPSAGDDLSLTAKMACLSVRILLDFDSVDETGRATVSELVEWHTRVVFAVPKHRQFMRTRTPSEPILAETAARFLNIDRHGEMQLRIDELGYLALSERGEMVTRLLWIIAHDKAIESMYGMNVSEGYLRFHRPISVIAFLKSLFHEDHHKEILNATPVGGPNGASLEETFKDAYLNFTHFALAADSEVLRASQIFQLLLRGTAIQCRNNKDMIHHVVPILFGDPAMTEIWEDAALAMQGHIKNRNTPRDGLRISPNITHPNHDLPVLSLQHELSASYSSVRCVERDSYGVCAGPDGLDVQRRHCHIVAYGTSSATYAAIPPSTDGIYASLLAPAHVIDDFPRASLPGSRKMLDQMLPALQYAERSFSWF
ncbi:hypothetical protein HETIRDRAFT_120113 [Heterobasidion irregulare TC 32-1]|uniref:Uncharacterized protein n=1 Tax=Heterobasidion irregulare (strain TC 32-1) TaxID=747525 RepID=W4JXF8_HETIT|nr:uncharacterized protein HETIRDRAFT_120113 [Heterobasidion irregulare TC 32-1]ETW78247.1 hypothetical protein HETIRDRAFT_120113 [Heterobasidion irregulare TC 32-1]